MILKVTDNQYRPTVGYLRDSWVSCWEIITVTPVYIYLVNYFWTDAWAIPSIKLNSFVNGLLNFTK